MKGLQLKFRIVEKENECGYKSYRIDVQILSIWFPISWPWSEGDARIKYGKLTGKLKKKFRVLAQSDEKQ